MLVSIIIPCYKMGAYIGQALESVGRQTCTDWEVLAVDDCGPDDGTREAIGAFAVQHPSHRIECIRHSVNRGVSAARNSALSAAKGEFLAFLDPDDLWAANYLESQVWSMQENTSIQVSYTGAVRVDASGEPLGETLRPVEAELADWPQSLYRRNFIIPSCVMVARDAVTGLQGFDETPELQHVEDWDLWLRLIEAGRLFRFNTETVALYREHTGAATQQNDPMIQRVIALRNKHLQCSGFRQFMAGYVTDLERENARLRAALARPCYLGLWRVAAKITPGFMKQAFHKMTQVRRSGAPKA